ncbi:unnamed protein product [Plutella xylostella]|uniref:(diamondback moth) hypothetical protein n=1 Tax=Plutella xylostella TaxID=51655 RepID=A0A8S4F4C3_PLUXY|nr:unnamed protein product [Plutella xylostella]
MSTKSKLKIKGERDWRRTQSAAIVKRDAEKPDENGIKKITDDLQKFGDTVAKGFKENFDMEKIQKQVNDGIKELQKNRVCFNHRPIDWDVAAR